MFHKTLLGTHLTGPCDRNDIISCVSTHNTQLDRSQPVAEADVCAGGQDAESSSAGVQGGSGLALLQLQLEVEQQQTQELLDLVDGKVSTWTHAGARAERHQVVLQLLAVLIEVCLLHTVLHEAVEAERLSVHKE